MTKFTYIDLFAGIGGFHLALHSLGGKCVFASEIDSYARKTYFENFKIISPDLFKKNNFNKDITKINPSDIPNFDILCAGFPCQPFSQAGHKKGFADSRGTLFYDIAKIINEKKPKAFFLENVRHLIKHDNGNTFKTIFKILQEDLKYSFHYKIIKASDFGLPQHRPRVFIVGFKNEGIFSSFSFPEPIELLMTMDDIWGGKCNKKIGYTIRVGGRRSKITDRRNWDSYLVNGKVQILGIEQAKKMQGFPEKFSFPVSDTQAMKQLGNSVAIPAIKYTAEKIIEHIRENKI